ncbi:MurR/RpiR family transcriptional regulator [Streptomyces sp. NPDC014734]|uniref:MurR/RpiR family transcriptional regulator n=1 Tax=Streptomyces sp. NPDC014734 TaxID=3364886 RepID=UPI0037024BB1
MTERISTVEGWLTELTAHVQVGPKAVRVQTVLAAQPAFCSYATAAEVAERAEVNGATVVRFAQSLGYPGWPQFQAVLRETHLAHRFDPVGPSGLGGSLLADALAKDRQNLTTLEHTLDMETVNELVRTVRSARRTLVVGAGTHGAPAAALADIAASRGLPIVYEDRGGGPHLAMALAGLGPEDCVIGWSFWQHYRQTVDALRIARRSGVPTFAVTDTGQSPAAEHADHVLLVPTEGVGGLQSMATALSLAQGIAAELAAHEPEASRTAAGRVDGVWQELCLFT